MVVVRKGKEETRSVTLGRLEDNERQASLSQPPTEVPTATRRALGLELSGVTDEMRRRFNIKDDRQGRRRDAGRSELGRRRQAHPGRAR